ncbi:ClpP/crotonase-like domain-containing protein [Aspergillus karnatakaensis]|uniref:enoyl-CoA hydratase/isomerase family protein n=1 Tax=Aspergillus karnatakaensis TaxID=1810916 RepID=UPI003CCE064E
MTQEEEKETASKNLVLVDATTSGVQVLTLNRPAKRNALSQDLIDELLRQLTVALRDQSVSSVVITGSGGFFSAGADIKEISQLDAEGARRVRYLEDLCDGVRKFRKPLIVAIEGKALGGGFELALMADFIVATPSTEFGLPEVNIGLIPGAGGTQRLTNTLGKYRAMRIILLNEPLSGTEASDLGLVALLTQPGEALQGALDLAAKLASKSPSAIMLAKEAICRADELGQDEHFERSLYYAAFGSKDKREGVAAFSEKRSPVWNGSG